MIIEFATKTLNRFAGIVDDIPGVFQPTNDLESDISTIAVRVVSVAAVSLIVLVFLAMLTRDRIPKLKLPIFILMSIAMAGSAITLVGSTVYLNVSADSSGPVHWHADIEMWVCGNEVELRDPTGFSNKIGTSVLHEHNDHRIHLEGVVVESEVDASIGKFMHVIGGAITEDRLVIPLNPEGTIFEDEFDGDGPAAPSPTLAEGFVVEDGLNGRLLSLTSGESCGSEESEVQVFVYRFEEDGKTYKQYKLSEEDTLAYFEVEKTNEFSIAPEPNVPPGDCIIFEFGPSKSKTDKLCEQYGVRDILRCKEFGVEDGKRGICENTQADYDADEDYSTVKTPADIIIEGVDYVDTSSDGVLGATTDDLEFAKDLGQAAAELLLDRINLEGFAQ